MGERGGRRGQVGIAPYVYLIGGVIAIEQLVPMDWENLIGNKDKAFAKFRSCLLRTCSSQ